METIQESMVFNIGHITPKISGNAYEPFKKRILELDPNVLCENIRQDMGYSLKSLENGMHPESELWKFGLIEKMITLITDSYNGQMRDNGHPAVTHPLMAGALGAATGEPTKIVLSDMGHDLIEDVIDPEQEKVIFRVKQDRGGFKDFQTAGEIEYYIRKNFGRYGKGLAADMRLMTRNPEHSSKKTGQDWERHYQDYLRGMIYRIGAVLGKSNDAFVNLIDINLIQDQTLKERKARKLVQKAEWQISTLEKLSWIKANLLKAGIAGVPGLEKMVCRVHDVSRKEIAKFEKGWTMNPARKFGPELLESVNLSGSPAIDVYRTSKPTRFEIELPFVQSAEKAHYILHYAFGKNATDIRRASSLLPMRLTSAAIYSFETSAAEIEKCMSRAVELYDDMLSSGLLLRQLEGFARQEWADAARARMERVLRERNA